ncbi:putative alpha mannosyltransferase protein [Botrytis fragariae]|uniref:Putative alpha mannosyltransferase protein n=1 Tax=Botrytis fragariae TaxID=1964551 RepID=A0A8H6EHI7_9HELO|nr:putative alpha mannosyltransferase protein [Botrytis fragariae]KAF5872386.1 putative alpha mannosyltransferase protein [Botrytis fragariae]
MPPHLHPRSKFTSSLFAGTLFASFFVVALPHVLPCPAPRVVYADDGSGSQRPRRRRRKCPVDEVGEQGKEQGQLQMQLKTVGGDREGKSEYKDFNEKIREEMGGNSGESDDKEEIEGSRKLAKRECPVPKPGGVLGGILGFKSSVDEKGSKPP